MSQAQFLHHPVLRGAGGLSLAERDGPLGDGPVERAGHVLGDGDGAGAAAPGAVARPGSRR